MTKIDGHKTRKSFFIRVATISSIAKQISMRSAHFGIKWYNNSVYQLTSVITRHSNTVYKHFTSSTQSSNHYPPCSCSCAWYIFIFFNHLQLIGCTRTITVTHNSQQQLTSYNKMDFIILHHCTCPYKAIIHITANCVKDNMPLRLLLSLEQFASA